MEHTRTEETEHRIGEACGRAWKMGCGGIYMKADLCYLFALGTQTITPLHFLLLYVDYVVSLVLGYCREAYIIDGTKAIDPRHTRLPRREGIRRNTIQPKR